MALRTLIAILTLVAAAPALGAEPVALAPGFSHVELSPGAETLRDPGAALGPEGAAASTGWVRSGTFAPVFALTRDAIWLRVGLSNRSAAPAPALLEVAYPLLDSVELFLPDGRGGFSRRASGDLLPFSSRAVPSTSLVFPVELPAGTSTEAYLRVRSNSTIWLPVALWSAEAFAAKERTRRLFTGVLLGFVFALVIYNAFLFATLRDRSYLWYVLYCVAFGLNAVVMLGLGAELLWPESPRFDNFAHVLFAMASASLAAVFASSFLETATRTPRIHLVLRILTIVPVVVVGVALWSHRAAMALVFPVIGTTPIVCTIAGVACLRRGFAAAGYYLAAWTALLASAVVTVLVAADAVPGTTLTVYGFLFAGVLEMSLLSIALANRIQVLRRELELQREQMFQMQKLEALGTLAGGVAHDFNNMLTAILGYASEIKLLTEPGDEVRRAAEVIERAGSRAAELTSQLLGFARKGMLQRVPVDGRRLVGEVARLLSRTIEKGIAIRQVLGDEPAVTLGDPAQLQQVLLNLAINARDAMPEGGELVIESSLRTFDGTEAAEHPGLGAGSYVVLAVADTGTGIPDDVRARMFEPFFTTKPQGKGTGMGLAMVYGIVKNHGGTVEVHTGVGRGSRFEVYLPADVQSSVAPAPQDAHVRGRGVILVVDDEEVVRSTARQLLALSGYEVETAEDGVSALQILSANRSRIDLVILDFEMPQLGGEACFRALRGLAPDVPIIMSTGHGPNVATDRLMAEGAAGLIQKPYGIEALSRAVSAALAGADAA